MAELKAIEGEASEMKTPETAEEFVERGKTHISGNKLKKAIADYNEAIRLNPDLAAAYYERGCVYCKHGNFDRAFEDLGDAIRLNQDHFMAYFIRAELYHNCGYAYKPEDDAEFMELYKSFCEMEGAMSIEDYIKKHCYVHYRKDGFDKAIADFSNAIRIKPDDAEAYIFRSRVYCDIGDFDRAIADCDMAIRLDPKCSWAHTNRSEVYEKMGDKDKADADYDQAIRLARDDNHRAHLIKTRKKEILDQEDLDELFTFQ